MSSSPRISFATGSDRELITADAVQALKASGTLILDERRSRTRYFDGRFLAAKDEIRDQNYFLTRLSDLGRAGGAGVVTGLSVSLASPTSVTVTAGQGVTPAGETVMVPEAVTIALADVAAIEQLDVAFGLSRIPRELARNRSGVFVLGLRPVEYTANPIASYPTTINGPRSVQDGDIIEAAAVVLVPYVERHAVGASADQRRARVARRIFADAAALGVPENVIPLAMLSIDRGVVQWTDSYMVRREVGGEPASASPFGFAQGALRRAHVLQYLNQVREIIQTRAGSNLGQNFAASEYFESLPPAGALPAAAINPADFSQIYFPPQVQTDISIIPEDEVSVLIEESLHLPPINLTDTPDELESTSVLILAPVPRRQLRGLQQTLTSTSSPLRPLMPGALFQQRPIQSLMKLTAVRLAPPVLNVSSPIDAAWRQALGQSPMLWYVRRRNLNPRSATAAPGVNVAGDDVADEKSVSDRLTAMGLLDRFNALKAKSTAAALATTTGAFASPAFAHRVLAEGALHDLEQNDRVTQAVALSIAAHYGTPNIGEGLARLEAINPAITDPAITKAVATAGVAPDLDRAGLLLDKDELTDVAGQIVTLARGGAADASQKIAALVHSKAG